MSGSAKPSAKKMVPAAPPMRPVTTEKSSWMRRRRRRSLKKEFQSRAGTALEPEPVVAEEVELE